MAVNVWRGTAKRRASLLRVVCWLLASARSGGRHGKISPCASRILTTTTQRNIVIVVNDISPVTAYVSSPSETDLSCSTTRAARRKTWSIAAMSFFPVWPHTGRQYTSLGTRKACKIFWRVRMFRLHPKRFSTPTILLTNVRTFDACVDHFRSYVSDAKDAHFMYGVKHCLSEPQADLCYGSLFNVRRGEHGCTFWNADDKPITFRVMSLLWK